VRNRSVRGGVSFSSHPCSGPWRAYFPLSLASSPRFKRALSTLIQMLKRSAMRHRDAYFATSIVCGVPVLRT
jgi:hypothetical protein